MGRVEWPGLMEREYELEAIDAAVAGVDEGARVFLMFDREPGIGKSALLHELTERAAPGMCGCRLREGLRPSRIVPQPNGKD